MNIKLLIPAFYGLIIGTALSYFLTIHSTKTASAYSYAIFNTDSIYIIKYFAIITVAFSIAFMSVFSALIRDLDYPTQNPIYFTVETLFAGIVPALLLFLMTYLRKKPFTESTAIDFTILVIKFSLVHILLQFSGVYSSIFKP
jgi:hypothetical protein